MAITYLNRRGQIYYLYCGKTKTGKPKYFFSMKEGHIGVKNIPKGFEIYENPNCQVFLRKIQPKIITDIEKFIVEKKLQERANSRSCIVDVKKNIISVFSADQNVDNLSEVFNRFPIRHSKSHIEETLRSIVTYSPQMQFVLEDKDERLFITKRFCYLGSVDDWIDIGTMDDLETLSEKFLKHIGQESYYDLH